MNPGKLIGTDTQPVNQPQDHLRSNTSHPPMATKTHFAFASDHGSLEHATGRCVGVGACRKEESGTMCPSYMATREEQHSTRGRAHLLWEMLQGDVLKGGWRNEQVREALDLCLACKACKTECPTNVDMATYKAEFLAHHYEGRVRPIGAYAFGYIDKWSRLASLAPGIANFFGQSSLASSIAKKLLHIHPQRALPTFSAKTYRAQAASLPQPTAPIGDVLLWADTFNNYLHSPTAVAAHKVLVDAGFRVHTLQQHVCCGRPLYDFGLLDSAKKYLLSTLSALEPTLAANMPIVVLEPSCATVFRDELTNLLPNDPRAHQLKSNTLLLSEFLVRHAPHYTPPQRPGSTFIVQGHCPPPGRHEDDRRDAIARRHRRQRPATGLRLLRHGRPLRFRARQVRRLPDPRRARPAPRRPRGRTGHRPHRRRLQLPRTDRAELPPPRPAPRRSPRPRLRHPPQQIANPLEKFPVFPRKIHARF